MPWIALLRPKSDPCNSAAQNAPHFKTAFTASRRSQSGKLRPEQWPEINPQGRTSPIHPNSSQHDIVLPAAGDPSVNSRTLGRQSAWLIGISASHLAPRADLHFEVTDQLLKLKFFPPGDEVISTPYWTLPTFMSPKYPFDLIHCRILLMSTVPLLVFEVRSSEMTL